MLRNALVVRTRARVRRAGSLVALGLVAMLIPRAAFACGGSGPGGTGACEFSVNERTVRVGASFGTTWSRISFGDGRKADTRRSTAYATVSTTLGRRTLLETSLGGLMPGGFLSGSTRAELGAGAGAAITFAWRVLDEKKARPFITLTATLSGLLAHTRLATGQSVPYGALDLRGGVNVGYTFLKVLRPYAVGRVFGGPIRWKYVTQGDLVAHTGGRVVEGTDVYKYQGGAGIGWRMPAKFDAFVEGIAVGEKGLFLGAGRSF